MYINVIKPMLLLTAVFIVVYAVDHFINSQAALNALSDQPTGTCINVENFNVCKE